MPIRFASAYRLLTPVLLTLCPALLQAGGFDVPVIATAMQGTANANSAEASDPSVIFYNPAGISRLHGTWVSNSFSALALRGRVENQGTTGTPPPGNTNNSDTQSPGATIQGGGAGSYWPGALASASLFASTPWNDEITLGFGLFPAAGGNLNNQAGWFGRNFADSTAVEIINANTVASIRFDEKHSVGIGTSVYVGHLKQKLQIDIPGVAPYLLQPVLDDLGGGTVGSLINGLLGTTVLPPSITTALNGLGITGETLFNLLPSNIKGEIAKLGGQILLTPDSNGSGTIEQYGYGFGWNIGYLFAPDDKTRIGIAYRSEGRLNMRGTIDWDVDDVHSITDNIPGIMGLPAPDGSGNVSGASFLGDYYRPDATTKSVIKLPARLSLGFFRQLNDKLDLMLDYTFIQSSVVENIKVTILNEKAPNGVDTISQKPGVILTNWRDSFKASVGMNYHYDDKLTLRTGYQYDKTPIPDPEHRHPSAPDSNRHMVSVGGNYVLKKNMNVDFAYSLVMLEDAESRYRDPCRGAFLEDGDTFTTNKPQDCTGNGGTFRGRFYDTYIHMLGLQLNTRF